MGKLKLPVFDIRTQKLFKLSKFPLYGIIPATPDWDFQWTESHIYTETTHTPFESLMFNKK